MKKTLLATTALVALGGTAYAQGVTLSGYAEMGLQGGDAVETQFHGDMDVSFNLSGETDNGLSFGAKIDLDEVAGGIPNRAGPDVVFISGVFGTLTLGDTDGAFDKALNDVASGTSLADDHSSHVGYSGNSALDGFYDGQILRYDYVLSSVTISASLELDDTGGGDEMYGLGANWVGDFGGTSVSVGLGYQDAGVIDVWGVSVKAGFGGGFSAVVNYSDFSTGTTHSAIGVTYSMDALTLHANWGEFDGGGGGSVTGFGLLANYDLGGGAVVMAGYGSGDAGAGGSGNGNGDDTWSLGLGLSF